MFLIHVRFRHDQAQWHSYAADADQAAMDLWHHLKDHVHQIKVLAGEGYEVDPTFGIPLEAPAPWQLQQRAENNKAIQAYMAEREWQQAQPRVWTPEVQTGTHVSSLLAER